MSKSALFATKKEPGAASSSSTKPVSKTAGMTFAISSVSSAVKTKNVEDAKKSIAVAEENLKTSLFQWKPDYISAAPQYERASGFYKTAEMMDLSRECLVKCADCHDNSGSYSGAAVAYTKAADMASAASLFTESKETHKRAAERWGLAGDLPKFADSWWRAGKEAGRGGGTPAEASELFTKALKVAYPLQMTTVEDLKALHPQLTEIVRSVFNFYLAEEMYTEAMALAQRMLTLFSAQGLEASANKARANVVVLLLQMGDVVAADQAFLEHLNDSKYLKSVDCRITEEYLMAFKFTDPGRLETAQKHADNYVFDREMQLVCRGLSLRSKKKSTPNPSLSPAPAAVAVVETVPASVPAVVVVVADEHQPQQPEEATDVDEPSAVSEPIAEAESEMEPDVSHENNVSVDAAAVDDDEVDLC